MLRADYIDIHYYLCSLVLITFIHDGKKCDLKFILTRIACTYTTVSTSTIIKRYVPTVNLANFSRSTLLSCLIFDRYSCNISVRPFRSGLGTSTFKKRNEASDLQKHNILWRGKHKFETYKLKNIINSKINPVLKRFR